MPPSGKGPEAPGGPGQGGRADPGPGVGRVQEESRAGIRPARLFLEAVASAAGL